MLKRCLLLITICLLVNFTNVFAKNYYYRTGKFVYNNNCVFMQVVLSDKNNEFDSTQISPGFRDVDVNDVILNELKEYEEVFAVEIFNENNNNIIEFNTVNVRLEKPLSSGTGNPIGKDYRLFRLENNKLTAVNTITYSTDGEVRFNIDKFGIYVLYYNPAIYEIIFYEEKPEEDESGNIITPEYHKIEDLRGNEIIEFPEIPKKEGYIFTGWVSDNIGAYYSSDYLIPQPIRASDYWEVYATWCKKEEYNPLIITVTPEEEIIRGEENGKFINVNLSEGAFVNEEIFSLYNNRWEIIGSDEISIETIERVDDKNVKIKLSGNSSNIYTDEQIKISFGYEIYDATYYDESTYSAWEEYDVKLDSNGVMCDMFESDNAINIKKQSLPENLSEAQITDVYSDSNSHAIGIYTDFKKDDVEKANEILWVITKGGTKLWYKTDNPELADFSDNIDIIRLGVVIESGVKTDLEIISAASAALM